MEAIGAGWNTWRWRCAGCGSAAWAKKCWTPACWLARQPSPAAEVASEPVADSPAEEAPAAPLASGSRIEPRLGDEPTLAG